MAKTQIPPLSEVQPRDLKTLVKDIPTLPVIYQQLFAMMQDPNVSIPTLAELISKDQALSAKVLHLVNSAFYGYHKQIGTISRALVILGFRAVRNAALAISVFDYFKGEQSDEFCDLRRFWEHSIAVGSVCKVLAQHTGSRLEEEAFVVGLLHDVGKLIVKSVFPDDFAVIIGHLRRNPAPWFEAERQLYPIDHAQIGKAVFRAWDFPPSIVEAIQFHHSDCSGCSYPQLAALVHVGDFLAHQGRRDFPVGISPDHVEPGALAILGVTLEDAMAPVDEYNTEINRALDLLKLVDE